MQNKAFLITLMLGFFSFSLFSQTNLLSGWDGNGDTNVSTSYPDNYGWDVTVGAFNYANASSGVRYNDVTSGHTLNGANYSGRLLMIRWDGAGSTSLNSVYSYPVSLEANTTYAFSMIYEWWNNASSPVYTVGISKDKSGEELIASEDFACAARNVLQNGDMKFYVAEAGEYYVTFRANNLAALGAIGELSLVETESVLECDVASVELNYYNARKLLNVKPNGSENEISVLASEGVELSETTLPYTGGSFTVSSSDSSNVSGEIIIIQGEDEITVPVTGSFPNDFFDLADIDTLNVDGAWCWFNDPRAVYYKGEKEQTYFSWVNSKGDIYISAYNHVSGEYIEKLMYPEFEVDDHDNPAIFIRKDGRIILYFSKHTTAPAHRFISTNPEDITSWGGDYRFGENVTYPYPFQVGDQVYVFYRGLNWHPTVVISDDDGETLGDPQLFVTGGGARPYSRFAQDATGAIHIAVTTGHPRQHPDNKIYYAKYQDGNFYKADGTFIKEYTGTETALDIDNNEAEVVYDASAGKGWIWDIAADENNNPVLVFASFPDDTDHRYHYARWTGSEWFSKQLTKAGKWFPQTPEGATEPEPNYSGGIILNYNNPSEVYLSKPVNGVFEIFRYTTPDGGENWKEQAITWNTPDHLVNVRPIVPRHHKEGYFDVVWMRGTYRFYTDYNTSLVFHGDHKEERLDSISISPESIELKKGNSRELSVSFYPFLVENKSLTWSSSDEEVVIVKDGEITAVGAGMATITATAFNGERAACEVTVSEPEYLSEAFFDFGTDASPVANGAIRITESTLLSDSYGWLTTVASRDRGAGASDELRDFNMFASDAVFKVFVHPGKYQVTVTQGDLSYPHDQMNVFVNDQLKVASVSNSIGSFVENTFDVEIENSFLEFRFNNGGGNDVNWVVNSLHIAPESVTQIVSEQTLNKFVREGYVRVFDLVGRVLVEERLNGRTIDAFLKEKNHLKNGFYILKVETSEREKTIKYIHSR